MFNNLSDRLSSIFSGLKGKGRLTEEDINLAMREIRMALLEAVFYCSSVLASEAPGPNFILQGLEGHALCKNDQEIAQKLLEPLPSPAVLQASSEELLRRFSWNNCAKAFVARTETYLSDKK